MDSVLTFDVLMYLNVFYFPLFAVTHPVMTVAKFFSPNYTTPELIELDAANIAALIISDLLKIVIFRQLRERCRVIAVSVAVFLTCVSMACTLYIFVKQEKVMRMEYTICTITFLLFATEILFGCFSFFPAARKTSTLKGLSNLVAITLTICSILGMLYVFMIQQPVIKMEYTLCGIAMMLFVTEFVYGFLQFLPCCKKKQYEY